MLWVLLKKQIAEVFRGYFYDSKKNRMRSKGAIAAYIVFFVLLMVGVLGGMFAGLSLQLCGSLTALGMDWLYFLLMCGIAILLGAFGSVFNSYSGLYLAKDNDLLLSLPIPVRTILGARLLNVYLLGAMYTATALIPMLVVYWIVTGVTLAKLVCGLALFVVVTVFVLLLSCVLGWVVAKISLRLKNKSFITVLVSLAFIGIYYFFYFKANDFIRNLILNADVYGEQIKGAAYGLYLFGQIGAGSWSAAGIFLAVMAAACLLVWRVLERSFLKIATASGHVEKKRYVEKTVRQKTPFRALLAKEFGRFASSSSYMLNCGLGILFLPAAGVLLLLKGREFMDVLNMVFANRPGAVPVLLCAMLCTMSTMNDMAAPAVSLEGKSIWIPQSLPVEAKTILRSKTAVHLILTLLPMAFAAVSAAAILPAEAVVRLLVCVTPLVYAAFSAVFGMFVGLRMPVLHWTNEMAPIKQSGAVAIALFGGWGLSLLPLGLYFLAGYRLGPAAFLGLWALAYALAGVLLQRWLDTRGAEEFAAL